MASLSLDFTGVGLGKSAGLQDLRAVGTASLHGQQQFLATDLLYCKNCMVLQGKIKSLEPSSSGPVERDVVCKYRDDDISLLEHEAGVYEGDLRELQGVAVPCFHGLFKGSYLLGSGKEKRIACIILDYIPSDRSWDLWDGPAETRCVCTKSAKESPKVYVPYRVAIAHTMLQIHKAGVLQGDFADANILVSGSGDVRIVDFDQATHHDCQADPEMNVWNYEPSECEYGCGEMYDAIQALELWTPSKRV